MATARYRGVQGRKDQNIKKLDRELREAIILKKRGFYEKLSQNGGPPPTRLVFVKSLFRFFRPFLRVNFF